jgi:peptidoglycan/LPS O-acetylase OafA/YrhL
VSIYVPMPLPTRVQPERIVFRAAIRSSRSTNVTRRAIDDRRESARAVTGETIAGIPLEGSAESRVNPAGRDLGSFTLNESMSVSLDGIRALAAQAVVVGHTISFFGVLPQLQPPFAPYMQNIGVLVFFVLSGYLISYTVWKKGAKGSYTFRTYAIERFARIFSGFLPGLAFIVVVDAGVILYASSRYAYANEYSVGSLVANLAMLQDHDFATFVSRFVPSMVEPLVAGVTTFGSGRPLWTLSIEWWIYMAFGWFLLAGATRSRYPIRYLGTAALVAALPMFNLVGGRGNSLTLAWLVGAFAFWLSLTIPPNWSARTSVAIALVLTLAAAYRVNLTGQEYDLVFACLLAGALYFLLSAFRMSAFRYSAPIPGVANFVAGYSLTLYLTHYTILAAMVAVDIPLPKPLLVVSAIGLCNVVAALIAWPTETQHKRFAAWLLARVPSPVAPESVDLGAHLAHTPAEQRRPGA